MPKTTPQSPFVRVAKKVCPAVITIVVSKDLSKVEGFYFVPMGDQQMVMPKVNNQKGKTKVGGGSGFIISSDGYIFTCSHVVDDPDASYTVIVDPKHKYEAKVLAKDPLVDVAILKIDGKNFPCLDMGDSDDIELGEQVLAVGNPLGEFEDTLSAGIVSGLSRKITAYGGTAMRETSLRGLIQTDAAINPGNSGGPLVNMEGEAIGINTAMVMGAQNLGFAIPVSYGRKILEEVMAFGKIKRPFLGVRYVVLNAEISTANKLPIDYGALVVRETFGEPAVIKGTAADKAGLQEYDIILEFGDQKICHEKLLTDVLQECKIGEDVPMKVLRDGKEIKLSVRLQERK
ncbi:MAG TPA: trypsin-like peptidase domain-containing protein [Candidatus Paceibacterota bacterium]|nr:trypsin-like peptidase domain-containing protein [Candidatus Pacearchaeota archaeon]HRZ51402.1 trypsin-like peptidase domain-containing protein [Candidatus Paceibacterota bacterium]HSA37124.1 trypsin-like peptidase domain-containing protein [Candidatus Paceibacterota bacterium]